MSYNAYVRALVPNNYTDGNPFVGHYVLAIEKDDVNFRGYAFDNPVFSYHIPGSLYIFPIEKSSGIYQINFSSSKYKNTNVKTWKFLVDNAGITSLMNLPPSLRKSF